MRRIGILTLTIVWLFLGMVSVMPSLVAAAPPATLRALTVSAQPPGGELFLRIEGGYTYRAVQATESTLFVDLKGVRAGQVTRTGRWTSGPIVNYRLLEYRDASGQPVVRLQVETKSHELFRVGQEKGGLRFLFATEPGPAGAAMKAEAGVPASPSPAAKVAGRETPAPAPAVSSGSPPSGASEVSRISIRGGEAGATFVDILTTRASGYQVLQLHNPDRLVVDLEGARNGVRARNFSAQSPVLKGVRVGQFQEAVVRVVADLIGDPVFDVHAISGGVRMELKPRTATTAVPVSNVVTTGPPAVQAAEAKPVQAVPASLAAVPTSRVVSAPAEAPQQSTQAASKAEPAKPEASSAPQSDYQSALPASPGSSEVSAAPRLDAVAAKPEALQASRAAKILSGRMEVVAVTAPGQNAGAAAEEGPKYSGEPISLNLKDVDLKDFFRLIHEISGLNIIVDPDVTGTVTLVLDAVPWDQALDIVLKNSRLDKTLEGNVLRIASVKTLSAEQEAANKLAASRQEAQPLVTVFRPINYAKAGTIATMIKSWVGGGALSKRGNILLDDRTNTLIISDISSQIPTIEAIISKLDKKAKQVSIEARIVLASSSFTRTFGVSLVGTRNSPYQSGVNNTSAGSGPTPPGTVISTTGTLNSGVTTAVGSVGGAIIAIHNAGAKYAIDAIITAAEIQGQVRTISRPTIVTQNNVAGTVVQGSQVPIQTTINNTPTVTMLNAALQLTVTPQVTEDGQIFLVINVTNASPGAVYGINPSIDTQSATTSVLVPDGGTVVFGGVTVTSRKKNQNYVPFLGTLPVIGHLFKQTNVSDSDNELLFFVSPKVLPG